VGMARGEGGGGYWYGYVPHPRVSALGMEKAYSRCIMGIRY